MSRSTNNPEQKSARMAYTVDCSNAIWSGREFTSRRKAEQYITRLRQVHPQLVREDRTFTIRRVYEPIDELTRSTPDSCSQAYLSIGEITKWKRKQQRHGRN